MSDSPVRDDASTIGAIVNNVAALLSRKAGGLSTGDVAALRRMDPRKPSAEFFKLEGIALDQALPDSEERRRETETRWAAIVVGLAHLGDLHRPHLHFGRSLADAAFSEKRFSTLLRADEERLVDELPMLARFVAAKGVPIDWAAAARLILSSGRADEEAVRRRIAREYYSAIAKQMN